MSATGAIDAQTIAAEQAAARRLQWEAAVRNAQMQRDARRYGICCAVVLLLISAALICALPLVMEVCVGSRP